ncbi:MAG TPA: polyphosphate kinase 1 [Gemmatimonadales bacterium]|nr:polyphosphate kinase 1 [Gemmatimonadales bacterium]
MPRHPDFRAAPAEPALAATPAPAPAPPPAMPRSDEALPVEPAPSEADLRDPALYINRELSWLEFNRRVLAEAQDGRTPLLERLKFLAIFGSNLDEFFQVRVGGLKQQLAAGYAERTADGMRPEDQLRAIAGIVRDLEREAYATLLDDLLPALADDGLTLHLDHAALDEADRAHLAEYFQANVFPVLTPLAVDPGHPFPYISNLSLSIAVVLRDLDGEERFARVKVPKILPRWVPLTRPLEFLPLEQVIGAHLDALFPGVEIVGWHLFRITRNTDYDLTDSEDEDLLSAIQEEVRRRRFAEVVRLEVEPSMPLALRQLLLGEFNAEQEPPTVPLRTEDLYEVPGPLDVADLLALTAVDLPALKDPPFLPSTQLRLLGGRNIFDVIREGDVLVHHPYDSFTTSVERFIQTAAEDPDVLAIKLTLYRTGGDSSIAKLLLNAAERGKQVAVLIELRARFDEENNITWAQRLEDAGVHVSYGVEQLKTHAKLILVVRREGDTMRRYVHIGTGNYNAKTARLYTDFGLFTSHPDFGADLTTLFNVLTGFANPAGYRTLLVAPQWMKERFLAMIRREIAHVRAGRPGQIIAKMNALVDPDVIAALYQASQAGVQVDLIVRGICCLRPGLPGVSERIRVLSLVGRFLEHSRAFYFYNGGTDEVYIGSADWMPRNLNRRIEAVAPVQDPIHRQTILGLLELMLRDERQAWELRPDGTYVQRRPGSPEAERGTQQTLIELAKETGRLGAP